MVDKLAAGAIGAGLGYAGILSGGVTGGAAAVLGGGDGFTHNLA